MRQDELWMKELVKNICLAEVGQLQAERELYDAYPLSGDFREKMRKIIVRLEKRENGKRMCRLAAIAAASLIILYTIWKPDYLVAAYQQFIHWFDDYVEFSGPEAEDPALEIPRYYLSYIPEGVEIKENEGYYGEFGFVDVIDVASTVFFSYSRSDGVINVTNNDTTMLTITAEDGTNLTYLKSDNEVYPSSLVWYSKDNDIIFAITGNLSQEELLKMYYGVKKY